MSARTSDSPASRPPPHAGEGATLQRSLAILLVATCLAACSGGGPAPTGDFDSRAAVCAGEPVTADNPPESPLFTHDPLGPISDVSCDWQRYQPAAAFCVPLDAPELTPGGTGPTTDGTDPACAFSGFAPEDEGLFKVEIDTPPLCAGCRRLFIDYSQIPENDAGAGLYYARGHAYYRIHAVNPTYTIDPIAHSPNTKNFTNDKLVAPSGSIMEQLIQAVDLYLMTYVTGTHRFAHTAIQGPYYIGPWYVNRDGERIHGVYLDVDVTSASDFGDPHINALRYFAGYNSGQATCLGQGLPGEPLEDGNFFYGGCLDRFGGSIHAIDPYAE